MARLSTADSLTIGVSGQGEAVLNDGNFWTLQLSQITRRIWSQQMNEMRGLYLIHDNTAQPNGV
jgi:hypothetical protein